MGTDPPSMTTWGSSAKVSSGIMIRLAVDSNRFGLLPHRRFGGPRRLDTSTTARPAPLVRRRSAAPVARWDRLGGAHRPIRTSPSASLAPLSLREAKDRRIRSYRLLLVDESVQVRHGFARNLQLSGELLEVVGEPACDRHIVFDEVVEEVPARFGVRRRLLRTEQRARPVIIGVHTTPVIYPRPVVASTCDASRTQHDSVKLGAPGARLAHNALTCVICVA